MDTTTWDRDPILLDVGRSPGDIVPLPDGHAQIRVLAGPQVDRFTPDAMDLLQSAPYVVGAHGQRPAEPERIFRVIAFPNAQCVPDSPSLQFRPGIKRPVNSSTMTISPSCTT